MTSVFRRLGLVAVVPWVFACSGEAEVQTVDPPLGRPDLPTPDQVVENGEHLITEQGVKKALLTAEQLYFYNQTGKVFGDTVQVEFYDETGAFVSLLTAQTGEMNQSSRRMIARGNVFVRGRDSTIKTEELYYDPQDNRIYSEVETEINQRGNVIRGRGVESDPALKEVRIQGGSAVLRSEPELAPKSGRAPPDSAAQNESTPSPGTDAPTAAPSDSS